MKKYNIFENSKGDTYIFIPVPSIIKKIAPLRTESDKLSFDIQYNAILDGNDIVSQLMNMGHHIMDVDILVSKFDLVYTYSNITEEDAQHIMGTFDTNIGALEHEIQLILGKHLKYNDVIIVKLLI